jgi:hypothetical protein
MVWLIKHVYPMTFCHFPHDQGEQNPRAEERVVGIERAADSEFEFRYIFGLVSRLS